MLKFESRDAPRDVCGGVELGQFRHGALVGVTLSLTQFNSLSFRTGNTIKCTTSSFSYFPCVGPLSRVSHSCLVRLSLVQQLAAAHPSLMPSHSALAHSYSISSLVRTHTRLRSAGGSDFVRRDATKATDAVSSSTFVIPARRLCFSALFFDLDSSACPLLPPFVNRLTHVLSGTENQPAITSKESKWHKMNDAREVMDFSFDKMAVEIDNFLTDPEVKLRNIYNHRGTRALKPALR